MGLKDEISNRINTIFDEDYDIKEGTVIPTRTSLTFGATAKKVKLQVLYIDMRGSKKLLENHHALSVLKTHKAFLYTIAKIIRSQGGEPRSFNGDSVLAFWAGNEIEKAKSAVISAMKISYMLQKVINPKIYSKYNETLDFGIGVDQGELLIGKSGIGGDPDFQDLIWLGNATYNAHCFGETARKPYPIWLSFGVHYDIKDDDSMILGDDGKNMWIPSVEKLAIGETLVYKTNYHWSVK